jgi:hypothetical protein
LVTEESVSKSWAEDGLPFSLTGEDRSDGYNDRPRQSKTVNDEKNASAQTQPVE